VVLPESPRVVVENDPVPNVPVSVVVAMTVFSALSVPYAKPRTVEEAVALMTLMLPFNTAVISVTDEAADVVTVGV
jgi:hypothetical protein